MRSFRSILSIAVASASFATAQTSTDCNPTNKTCPADTGLDEWSISSNFINGEAAFDKSWTAATGTTVTFGDKGAIFNITAEGQAPTVSSDFYFFFGQVEVKMQAATGTGIVSSIVLESDDLDEIDWEWLGGNNTSVETNYFGKGNTTTYNRAIYYDVDTPTSEMHTYLIDWTEESIKWSIDGTVVRTLLYADANGGDNFPQTPLRVKLGNWCGGCSSEAEGTIEWAGGNTTFNDAPYIMYVESVKVINYNPASSYNYTNESGSYDSIDASNSTTVSTNLNTTSSASAATASVATVTESNGSVETITSTASSTGTATTTGTSSATDSFSQSTSTSSSAGVRKDVSTYATAILGLAAICFLL